MKKTVKVLLTLLLCLTLCVALIACGNSGTTRASEGFEYELKDDGTYEVVGIGTCTDRDIVIPSSYKGKPVTSIGSSAFYISSSLTSVTISDSVTSIGGSAFENCSSLTSVTIPDSVTYIGEDAFYSCDSLANIKVSENNPNYKDIDGNLYTKDGKALIQYAIGKTDTSFTIPSSVTYIGQHAFYNCSSLTSVTIPDSVTEIGYEAFCKCSNLTSVTIPDSVTSIGSYAFSDCDSLVSIKVSESNPNYKDIDGNLYSKDGKALIQYAIGKTDTSFTIPSSVTEIGYLAFYGCSSLKSVTIPDSVTSIGGNAFWGCSSLASVTIGNGVTYIGEWAFSDCDSLVSIKVSESNPNYKDIDGNLYSKDGKTLILYAIGKTDTSFTIPSSVTSIGYAAFSGCSSLTSVIIGNSVTSIGNGAFSACDSLASVTIGNGVTSIGYKAFYNCSSLASVTIPNSVTEIGYEAFAYCSSLVSIKVSESNPNYKDIDGNLYSKDGKTLILYAVGKTDTSFTIPSSVTEIGQHAFEDCDSLTSITIPDSVTYIGSCAFWACSSLASVTIPDSVTSIGDYAFYRCSSLTSIHFNGTKAEWKAMTKGTDWKIYTGDFTVYCSDGNISKADA